MKYFVLLLIVATALAAPKQNRAVKCDDTVCKLPNCRCSSTDIPGGLDPKQIPQLVFLTFDDAVTALNFERYEEAFFKRKNPDGCPITTTYFVSHEYSDYEKVHELHSKGHEIALHSITHTALTDYWKGLTVDELVEEFGGERELVSEFASIDKDAIKGMRLPLLQLSGENSFVALKESGLTYDCSWPTQANTDPGLWPYTLDYGTKQDCPITPCPSADIQLPGVWIVPMVMWFDDDEKACSMVDACANLEDDEEVILAFLKRNFHTQYDGNRAPVGVYMHEAWFGQKEFAWPAYLRFLDYLQEQKDVYLVNIARGLEWVKNPSTLENLKNSWPACEKIYKPNCKSENCRLVKETGEERYMNVCGKCPDLYPWLGNPLGES